MMIKRLCKYSRSEILANINQMTAFIVEPSYICKTCLRSANTDKALCKPMQIGDTESKSTVNSTAKLPKKVKKLEKKIGKLQKKRAKLELKSARIKK
jgi:hypothetical protein